MVSSERLGGDVESLADRYSFSDSDTGLWRHGTGKEKQSNPPTSLLSVELVVGFNPSLSMRSYFATESRTFGEVETVLVDPPLLSAVSLRALARMRRLRLTIIFLWARLDSSKTLPHLLLEAIRKS